jgi:lipoyl(octanoyl) transferase
MLSERSSSTPDPETSLVIRELEICDYLPIWEEMRDFTQSRNDQSLDQIWYLQHPPVYTLGLNGKQQHLLKQTDIPVIPVDRGGQITYHGPGQLVVYLLIDLERQNIGVKDMVAGIEQAVIDYLKELGIWAGRKSGAPGIYVEGAKIAALGLRIKKGRSYHGLSLNVDMDLTPFSDINPCGYEGMPVTQLADLLGDKCPDITEVRSGLHDHLCQQLGYNADRNPIIPTPDNQ